MIKLSQIHNDKRGEIYLMKGDLREHEEVTFFVTKKGFARGGCIHLLNDEFTVVLEGRVRYFIGKDEFILSKGESSKIPRNMCHYFVSLEDSLVVEWGCIPAEKLEKHEQFRKIVDDINKNQEKRRR